MIARQPCRGAAAARLPAVLLLALVALARVGAQDAAADDSVDAVAELDSLILDAVQDLDLKSEYPPHGCSGDSKKRGRDATASPGGPPRL